MRGYYIGSGFMGYVDGQYMYNSTYYPKLIALYIDYSN